MWYHRAVLLLIFSFSSAFAAPKISICIPVYNVEPWLPAALDSACNQTLKDIEIICVDDGSTDGSLAILKSYAEKDRRIKVLENGTNRGTLYARIRAALATDGDYILWLDPDDELFPDIAEKALAAAEQSGADIVFFRTEEIKKNGKRKSAHWNLNVAPTTEARNATEIPALVRARKMSWNLCTRLWRGDLLRSVASGQLDLASRNHISVAEDKLLFYFAMKKARTYFVLSDFGYRYFRNHGGVTVRQRSAAEQRKIQTGLATVRMAISADDADEPVKAPFL